MTQSTASPGTTDAPTGDWLKLGIAFGLVSAASILLYGPIGVSGTYPRVMGWLGSLIEPAFAENAYLQKIGSVLKPETFLVLGLPIGGFLAARLAKVKPPACEYVHAGEHRTPARRYRDAFLGGFLILFGARLAGGCTSGHIISGMTQLAVSGLIFGAAVFATGIFTAKMIRKEA